MSDLLPVLLGGALALAGGLVGQLVQHAWKTQEAKAEQDALIRTKGEELFQVIARVRANTEVLMLKAIDKHAPRLSDEDLDFPRMYAISAAYFPELMPLFSKFRAGTAGHIDALEARKGEAQEDHFRRLSRATSDRMTESCNELEDALISAIEHHFPTQVRQRAKR